MGSKAVNRSRLTEMGEESDEPFPDDDQHYQDHHGTEVEHSKGQVAPNGSQNRFRHLKDKSLNTDEGGIRPAAGHGNYVGQQRSAQYASEEKSKYDVNNEIKQGVPLLPLAQPDGL